MREKEEKKRLVEQMGSRNNTEALQAVRKLRDRKWLRDGTLEGADLFETDLRGANLMGAKIMGANLMDADLRGADLRRARLMGTDLRGTDLREADLRRAKLMGADLRLANLMEANLRRADLRFSNLNEANLNEANLKLVKLRFAKMRLVNLMDANLSGAVLGNVDLTSAICLSTIFADVDLSAVKGLETVEHRGPSTIGVDTLYKSQGEIPEIFLRGCGMPDDMILFIPSLLEQEISFYSYFITYSQADKPFAQRVFDTLQEKGIRCWLDEKAINSDDSLHQEVDHGIRQWDKLLLCCSEHSLKSWWVDDEIDTAFEKERDFIEEKEEKILALIPLDLDGHMFSDEYIKEEKSDIQSRLVIDFTGWEDDNAKFEQQMEKVVRALKTDGGKVPPPESKL